MLTRRTKIGIIVGAAIIALGLAALIDGLGIQSTLLDDIYIPGEFTTYEYTSPAGTYQFVVVTADSFDITISSPGDIPQEKMTHKESAEFGWAVTEDGRTRIDIQNTGPSDMYVSGTIEYTTNPLLFTYHILVITTGAVIIGLSAGFSARKPKGF